MRAMSFPQVPGSGSGAPWPHAWRPVARALVWGGIAAGLAGLVAHDIFEGWRPPRTLLVLALCGLLLAWPLRRFGRCSWATAIATYWCVLLPVFADPVPVLATLLAAVAAAALGGLLLRDEGAGARCIVGAALGAGVIGWLLPLPVHLRTVYLVACLVVIGSQWQSVLAGTRVMQASWSSAVAAAPRSAALAVLLLGVAGTSCWLPTMQHDDIGYHLYLPWSLQLDARHPLDPEYHVWALAPWLADVVQAIPQVLAGAEARGPVNALWLVLAGSGLWRLCLALGGDARMAWWTVALWSSLPLTTALAGGMQTELPTTALLAWLVVLAHRPASARAVAAMAVLAGALIATKVAAAAMALAMLPWLAWRQRKALTPGTALLACGLLAATGGSSYAYAMAIAGNPVLPLANSVFESPYFQPGEFIDPRWHAGFDLALPWNLTFDTGRYMEAAPGAAGLVLVALGGAWLVAAVLPRTRMLALLAVATAAGLLAATQYLRYVYPLFALALPALVVAVARVEPRGWMLLLLVPLAANLALLPRGHWMLGANAVKRTLSARGADTPLYAAFAPERQLAAIVRDATDAGTGGNVLVLGGHDPMPAEFGRRARTITWYDPSLHARAASADRDPTGAAWAALLRDERIGEIMLRPDGLPAPRRAALERLDARPQARLDGLEWWRIAIDGDAP